MRGNRFASVAVLLMLGCDSGGEAETVDAGISENALRVATYNGGLARGFVDYATARSPVVIEGVAALAEAGLDVLCVQEFWTAEDFQGLADGASSLEHTHRIDPDPGECATACAAEDADPLEACARMHCADEGPDQLAGCVTTECGDEFNALAPDCITCVAGHVGESLDDILDACGPDAAAGSCFAYEGSFGTGILSRYPIAERDSLVFESHLNRRAVLYARIPDTSQGEIHFFCTHLTANLGSIPFPGAEGTWATEQRTQIDEMREWAAMKAGDGQIVMTGDFNCGPAVAGGRAELPENYAALTDGYDPTYTAQADAQCTFCSDNALVAGDNADNSESELIDHVLLRGFGDARAVGTRILTEPIQVEAEGMTIDTAYSDHYGISVAIDR